MRVIDADALLTSKWWDTLTNDFDKAKAKIIIQSAKTVDAVEVVRCKDCIWYGKKGELDACNRIYGFSIAPMMPDDYCSYGKRKENT